MRGKRGSEEEVRGVWVGGLLKEKMSGSEKTDKQSRKKKAGHRDKKKKKKGRLALTAAAKRHSP